MFDVKIKCLCLKYVKIVLEKCSKNVLNITHLPVLKTSNTNNHNLVVANNAFYDAIYIIQFD